MRIVFMGTAEFSVPTLANLAQHHSLVGVYTQPPKPFGRGYKLKKSPVQVWAEEKNLNCFSPAELKSPDVQEKLRALKPEVIVVVAYGLILPKAILTLPFQGCYNVHFSLLPRWRGAAPMQRALQAGDTVTGVTVMKMDTGLDTGPIIAQQSLKISPLCNYEHLSHRLSLMGAELMAQTLNQWDDHAPLKETVQPEEGITYANKLKKHEGFLNWHHSAGVLHNLIRAFNPWPGTSFLYQQQRIKVLQATVEEEIKTENVMKPGTVIDEHLRVHCGGYNPFTASWEPSKILRPLMLQKPGSKAMSVEEFLRGTALPKGTVLE